MESLLKPIVKKITSSQGGLWSMDYGLLILSLPHDTYKGNCLQKTPPYGHGGSRKKS